MNYKQNAKLDCKGVLDMYQNPITFQFATHFLSRIALRLEFLFRTINQASQESHEIIHRYALKNIIKLIEIIEKPELKSRFIKELIRIEHTVKKNKTIIDSSLFEDLEKQIHILNLVPGGFNNLIREDQFLRSLRQIYHPNTQECEFNSPYLIMWLDLDPLIRQETINNWIHCLRDIETSVQIYLSLLKETSDYIAIKAHKGFYQHTFPKNVINHLILLKMEQSSQMLPKVQSGHNNLIIRLYDHNSAREINDITVEMEIAYCQI